MKTFLVSLSIIFMGICSLVFRWDLSNYQQMQAHLIAATESSALCGAIADSQGEDCSEAVGGYVDKLEVDSSLFSKGNLRLVSCQSQENRVTVTLEYEASKGYFRMQEIGSAIGSNKVLRHTSCYAYEKVK